MRPNLADTLRDAVSALASSSSPRLDAEVLVMHVTGLTRTQLVTRASEPLAREQQERIEKLLTRRARGEPVAYVTGRREFWSMELLVTPDVLIPRPETELLVEQALARIPPHAPWTVADLGTGSGAIALAIAQERPHCQIIATDASPAALAVASANADRLGLRNIEFRPGEWLAPLASQLMDIIVSNPPYVAEQDPHVANGDLRFEPRSALVAGRDGLDAIRQIATESPAHLRPGGWLILEHGFDQAIAVAGNLEKCGYREIRCYRDLAGLDRTTAGTIS